MPKLHGDQSTELTSVWDTVEERLREDAGIFFGRGREIRQLYDRMTAPDGAPIVLLYGQSGVGKSSLLAAGLASEPMQQSASRSPAVGVVTSSGKPAWASGKSYSQVAAISFRQALRFVRLQIRFGGRTARGGRAARSDQS